METTKNQITKLLYAAQAVGIAFIGVYLAAYLAGLPTTAVLHSDLLVNSVLDVLGGLFLVLILVTVVTAILKRKQTNF